mmetsp:Transcript_9218/g.11052  ORF Transcript_9218/g.11052 Transcript_9218/m.11052 type:complete len:96 (-) Transcript_9218:95-382(-)
MAYLFGSVLQWLRKRRKQQAHSKKAGKECSLRCASATELLKATISRMMISNYENDFGMMWAKVRRTTLRTQVTKCIIKNQENQGLRCNSQAYQLL